MTFLVVNCNDWIGFHIVNELLDNDFKVSGMENENKSDHLSMFFGRNSSFSFVEPDARQQYDTVIVSGGGCELEGIQSNQMVVIGGDKSRMNVTTDKNKVYIKAPFLFGEWMPMDENGIYVNDKHIAFESEIFNTNAIYIKDFTRGLVQWLKTPKLPREIEVKSATQKGVEDIKLENAIYLRSNSPIKNNVKKVRDHYQMYKESY